RLSATARHVADCRLAALTVDESREIAPILFRGPAFLLVDETRRRHPQLRGQPLSLDTAGGGFLRKRRPQPRRATPLAETANDQDMLIRTDAEPDLVTQFHGFGRLGAFPVDIDLSAGHRLRRERSRLEEPRRPQPLVDSDRV